MPASQTPLATNPARSALLNKSQAAEYLNVTPRWMSRNHGIPFVQIGGRKYYLRADLDAFINAHRYEIKR